MYTGTSGGFVKKKKKKKKRATPLIPLAVRIRAVFLIRGALVYVVMVFSGKSSLGVFRRNR